MGSATFRDVRLNTCRFCKRFGSDGFVKYGTRHYACHGCYLDAGKTLEPLSLHQIEQFPWFLLKERGLLDTARKLIEQKSAAIDAWRAKLKEVT